MPRHLPLAGWEKNTRKHPCLRVIRWLSLSLSGYQYAFVNKVFHDYHPTTTFYHPTGQNSTILDATMLRVYALNSSRTIGFFKG